MAQLRKKKVAAQLGIDPSEDNTDAVEFLRAQGQLLKMEKEERAQKAIAAKMAKECTFQPETNKKVLQPPPKREKERTSIINQDAKKREGANEEQSTTKYE